ncbi:MAG TPA: ABC transporter ATP-binding protein [Clostridia bacterium]|nr:ABC transporter ATP-binding protein [Clostridia bacterium]
MLLKLDNIGKIYNSDNIYTIGIRNINLEFDCGEFVIITGASGSGKSTLLNVIAANDTYEEGELYINGESTSHYGDNEWDDYRKNYIATVFQDFNIIENLSVKENILLALFRIENKEERNQIASSLIEKVGLGDLINQKASKLSGGEKQRTVIARAIAKDSPIIIADEPTGNLDRSNSYQIARVLKEGAQGKLIIVVTHNPEYFEKYATRKIVLSDGALVEDVKLDKAASSEVEDENSSNINNNLEILNDSDEGIYTNGSDTQDTYIVKPEKPSRFREIKTAVELGVLNYKSRTKFTLLMTFVLIIACICFFVAITVFNKTLVSNVKEYIDSEVVKGKVIVLGKDENVNTSELEQLAKNLNAKSYYIDNEYTQFDVTFNNDRRLSKNHTVKFVVDSNKKFSNKNNAEMIIPISLSKDANIIKDIVLKSQVGIESINIKKSFKASDITIYFDFTLLQENAKLLKNINSKLKINQYTSEIVSFKVDEDLAYGAINLVNSQFWNVKGKKAVLDAYPVKTFLVADDTKLDNSLSGLVVELSRDDYDEIFKQPIISGDKSTLFFESDKEANNATQNYIGDEYIFISSNKFVYVWGAEKVFIKNIFSYLGLLLFSVAFAILISIIFNGNLSIFIYEFTIHKTLGIANKTSKLSFFIQMIFIFLPTIVFLPIVSLLTTILSPYVIPIISFWNYIFIEIMMFIIILIVTKMFNSRLDTGSIIKQLSRGTK